MKLYLAGLLLALSFPSQAATVTIYPAATTVEQTTKVPFVCDAGGNTQCVWTLVSGVGSITPDGIYTAPASNGSAVIKAVNGSSSNTANITVSGTLPTYSCSYTNTGTAFNKCTMQHQETAGGTITRYYNVVIPKNYVPGASGLVVDVGGTSHGIKQYADGGWCNTTVAGSEEGGWGPYLLSVPSPAPIMVCLEGVFLSTSNQPEKWHYWGVNSQGWDNGVVPNDPDFARQVVLSLVRDLNLDPKKVFITDDWYTGESIFNEIGIVNSDLFAAIGGYSDMFPSGTDASFTVQYGLDAGVHIPSPGNPISVITLNNELPTQSGSFWTMCGTNLPNTGANYHPLTIDDVMDYYAAADGITTFAYGDKGGSNTKFCNGTYNNVGDGLTTTLEMESGTGGKAGTAIAAYKLVGSAKATPYCSYDWNGSDTYCVPPATGPTNSGPPLDLRNTTCNWVTPCNHFVDTTTGYDIKGLVYKFFLAHPKGGLGGPAPIAVTVSPTNATITSGGTQQFTATVTGSTNTAVTWSATKGSISSSGLYTAPVTTFTIAAAVTAKSVADPTKSATASVTINPAADTTAPTTSITAPANGATVSGTITVSATATDNVAVASVQFLLDGSNLGTIAAPPYQISWDTTKSSNGSHSLTALATDTSGNAGISAPVTVTVSNTAPPPPGGGDNRYCNANETTNFSQLSDGVATLPRKCVRTAAGDTPSPGAVVTVAAGDGADLQAKLTAAACGQTIKIPAVASGVQQTYAGAFTVPALSCPANQWVTVETDQIGNAFFPAEGTQATPCSVNVASVPNRPPYACAHPGIYMPKLIASGANARTINITSGASHWRFIGLALTNAAGTTNGNAIFDANDADHIIADRLLIYPEDDLTGGPSAANARLGVNNVGSYQAVIDSYIFNLHCNGGSCVDAQGIISGLGASAGPMKWVNNFLEATGEPFFSGGGAATVITADFEIRRNHAFHPLSQKADDPSYNGTSPCTASSSNVFGCYKIKNLGELKNGQFALIEGNILENVWFGQADQDGAALLLTPKNPNNTCPGCTVADVTVRYNLIKRINKVFEVAPVIATQGGTLPKDEFDLEFHDNLGDYVNGPTAGTSNPAGGCCNYGIAVKLLSDLPTFRNVNFSHNTFVQTVDPPANAQADGTAFASVTGDINGVTWDNFTWTDNIAAGGIKGNGVGGGVGQCINDNGASYTTLGETAGAGCFTSTPAAKGWCMDGNVLVTAAWPGLHPNAPFPNETGSLTSHPSPNCAAPLVGNSPVSDYTGIGFVNFNNGNGGDYHLSATSPYKKKATDGKDPGADIDCMNAVIAGGDISSCGDPPPPPPVTVSVSPTAATLASGATQQFTAAVTGSTNTAVIWSATKGTVNSSGLYTAPATTFTITATVTAKSVADPAKSASATVTVSNAAPPPPGGGDNRYCGPGNVPLFGASDGPAKLPQACFYTAFSATPSPGTVTQVLAGANLQTAINNAQCGDTLMLQAGASFSVGNLTLPAKNCDDAHWITVRTSALDSQLPPEGTRITPCYAGVASLPGRPSFNCQSTTNVMSQVVVGVAGNVTISGDRYRLIGLEITRVAGGIVYTLVPTTGGSKIILDRVWVHGTATDETAHGVSMNDSHHIAIIDSFISDLHCKANGACTDAQAISGGLDSTVGVAGTYKIVNNFLEGAAENILYGGGYSADTPGDIEVRRNHLFKPMTWNPSDPGYIGTPFIVKNHFELKNGQRVLVEGNVMENVWGGFSQSGNHILLTPKNQSGGPGINQCPLCEVLDVTIRYNHAISGGAGLQLADGANDNGADAAAGNDWSIHDMLVENVGYPTCYKCSLYETQVSEDFSTSAPVSFTLHDLTINHITQVGSYVGQGGFLTLGGATASSGRQMYNINFNNSIYDAGYYGPWSTGGTTNCAYNQGSPKAKFDACWASYSFAGNVLAGGNAIHGQTTTWPSGNNFPADLPSVGFVNYAPLGGDYHLAATSPYKKAGTDGKDPGADIDCMNTVIAGGDIASCGNPPPPPPVTVSVSPTNATLASGTTQQFTAAVTGSTNTAVTWSATKGSISSSGLYTAPATTFTITATVTAKSVADPTKSATASVTINPLADTQPPTVSITSPANGAMVSSTITVSATATDNVAVASVQFLLDGVSLGTVTTPPYQISWNTALSSNGPHILTARATDGSGNAATSAPVAVTVSNSTQGVAVSLAPQSPTVLSGASLQFTATVTGSTNTAVTWSVTNNSGSISPSGLFSAPVTTFTVWNTVVAKSVADPTKSASTIVKVIADTTTPVATWSTPADGAVVSGVVALKAFANDNVAVASVQFQLDGVNLGAPITKDPYTYNWDTTSARDASHTLTVVATDVSGNQAKNSITVTIKRALNPKADVPGLRSSFVYPNPATRGQAPVIRASLGLVDSIEITIFDASGRVVHDASLSGAPTGVNADGDYYYDYAWTGPIASGLYHYVLHGKKADGTVVRARGALAVVR